MAAGTVVGIFLVAVIVLGYVVLWAVWHFFFRGRDIEHRQDPWSEDQDGEPDAGRGREDERP